MKLNFLFKSALLFTALISFTACSSTKSSVKNNTPKQTATKHKTKNKSKSYKKNVIASYYHDKFNGRTTASGEKFNNNKLTAAHKTLPFGTIVKVTNTANNQSVIVKVNDRGPFTKGREIDLSKKAFFDISENKKNGLLHVNIEILD
ncbi:septal ring lytic transglycosylase RlpA family protein [Flavobacterium agricola]|uniref:Probable endolytic peptidoglycan transglycosylase RlpA n=1 Tax=Flavobacterium agricola TaxID=2870839 RepID=A0ABY6LWR3_9FLAO|nr:septal ring lytic transglycosylase RlpA family protein [Flavobacterium agricola]UYW00601.1 septal ring lytic transglycosylase RlpA family protein [Flavobacterium agricola]